MRGGLQTALTELLSSTTGKVGVTFFLVMLLISLYAIITNPLDFGTRLWNNPAAWADNPKNVPPAWTGIFEGSRRVNHTVFEASEPTEVRNTTRGIESVYTFNVDYTFDEAPTFTSFSIQNVTYHGSPPSTSVSVMRPDGRSLSLYRFVVPAPRNGETPPILRYQQTPFRVHLSGEPSVAVNVAQFLQDEFQVNISSSRLVGDIDEAVFGIPDTQGGGFQPLKGEYQIVVVARSQNERDSIEGVKFVLGGSQFGMMGTDSTGRDLARGLIFGFPVALAIGLITAVMATVIGTTMGIISGYTGGKTDILIQRFSDVLSNIPLLPILLFLAFILGQKLWIVIAILIVFGWPGMAIVIRSMVLQIRSGQLVEASISLGASRWRIMLRHIFPQMAPFVFAQMIFFTPAAILAEAGLSFLGLGDPSIPTWGQILDQGFRTGAVYVGYWWWVMPPGILIVLTALTFVLIALGMERVVDPRLRTVRQ
ncbi:MAG: ABC transporter permease [Chloroflexi bacterium]|nr:ABC transporter permease [Chloroflexota bacterium]